MGCNKCGKNKTNVQEKGDILQAPTCNRFVTVCGTINLPQGFVLSDQGNLQFGLNACLECRTEDVTIQCTPDNCSPIMIPATAVQAVGCFNYVISVPVQSACPATVSAVSLENSACVNQVVCIENSSFECDPVLAACDIAFIFLGVTQILREECTVPSQLDVVAVLRLFENVCSVPTPEYTPEHGNFDRVEYFKDHLDN